MPKLRYVGTKADGERAFEDKTKIVWMPGSVHEVSAAHAALMLPHTDVWDLVDEAKEAERLRAAADAAASEAARLAAEADAAQKAAADAAAAQKAQEEADAAAAAEAAAKAAAAPALADAAKQAKPKK
jgi:hypothetical protein